MEDFIPFLSDSDKEGQRDDEPVQPAAKKMRKSEHKHTLHRSTSNNPWLRPVHSYSRKTIERLHQEIVDLNEYLMPNPSEQRARQSALTRLTTLVHGVYGANVQIEPFGSFKTGLLLPSSDIDLVIVIEDSNAPVKLLRKLARALIKARVASSQTVKVISKARVPIIKYIDLQTGYPVDVSINVGSGLEGAKMMAGMLRRHTALRPLSLFLKYYLSLRGLNEVFSGGVGSFSLMCMVVSFLELHPLLQMGLIDEMDNVGVLLMDFLELYTKHFNYDVVGITLRGHGYFNRQTNSRLSNHGCNNLLSIEDPQNPENDVSKGSFQMNAVKQSLEHAFMTISNRMAQCERGRPCHLLSSLLHIPDKIISHRSFIQQSVQ